MGNLETAGRSRGARDLMVLAMAEASATTPPAPARKVRVQKPDHPAFPRGGETNKRQPVAHDFFADERRRSAKGSPNGAQNNLQNR